MTTEMAATALQAVLAACRVQCDSILAFEAQLPPDVVDFLTVQASRFRLDPTSALQRLANALHIQVSETFETSGPVHAGTYTVGLELRSKRGSTVTAKGQAPSKAGAKKAAAADVLMSSRVLVAVVDVGAQAPLARMMLEGACDLLPDVRHRWPAWCEAGWMGAGFLGAGDTASFVDWSENARRLLAEYKPSEDVWRALVGYYELIRPDASAQPLFRGALTQALSWVRHAAEVDETAILDDLGWQSLIALAAAQSIRLKKPGEGVDVGAIVDDWILVSRGRLHVNVARRTVGAEVSAVTGAAILRCLQEFGSCLDSDPVRPVVDIKITNSDSHTILAMSSTAKWRRPPLESLVVTLVAEAAPLLALEAHEGEVRLVISRPLRPTNWLLAAAFAPVHGNDIDQQLGRLLHDLKNEVNAARLALREVPETRIERLEAQLAGSRHLEEAASLASRLGDADRLMSDGDLLGETDLREFLRSYVRDALSTLPNNIRLLPPAGSPALIAVGERGLRTILDNLVKNAVEAMTDGGDIVIDYLMDHDDGTVLIEVTDTGPGIAAGVVAAVSEGHTVPTSRGQGSGIGLVGVHRLIRRVGGSMEPVGQSPAKGWALLLPIAVPEPAGEQVG